MVVTKRRKTYNCHQTHSKAGCSCLGWRAVTCKTFLICEQNFSVRAKTLHSLMESVIKSILSEFVRRLTDFASIEPFASYLCFFFCEGYWCGLWHHCFTWIPVQFRMRFSHCTQVTVRSNPGQYLSQPEKMCLQPDSTFWVNLFFSHIVKSRYRSTMTDDHPVACQRLATSSYCPDYEKLASSSKWQRSH